MKTTSSQNLYIVEPHSARLVRWFSSVTQAVVAGYWGLFRGFGTIFLFLFAIALAIAGASELVHASVRWYFALPRLVFGLALLLSRRARIFAWAFLGCTLLWVPAIALPFLWFFGPEYQATSVGILAGILALYFVPPCIAALVIHRVRSRSA
jgi:hypothetical protein